MENSFALFAALGCARPMGPKTASLALQTIGVSRYKNNDMFDRDVVFIDRDQKLQRFFKVPGKLFAY